MYFHTRLHQTTMIMRVILLFFLLMCYSQSFAGSTSTDANCDFTSGVQYSGGATTSCACTWDDGAGGVACAFGNCGNSNEEECYYGCNGLTGGLNSQPYPAPYVWHTPPGVDGYLLCSTILPVEMSSFYGVHRNGVNQIVWQTTSEHNCDYFELYHSTDAENFEKLIELDGSGTTQMAQTYDFHHFDLPKDIHYYRLRQVDFDGRYYETYVISLSSEMFDGSGLFSEIVPNPAIDQFHFNYGGHNFNEPIEVKIFSLSGEMIKETTFEKFNNSLGLTFDARDYDNGFYWVIIRQGDIIEQKKLSVVH